MKMGKKVLFLLVMLSIAVGLFAAAVEESAVAEPVELKVMVFDRGNVAAENGTSGDNYWTQWINAEVLKATNIDVQYQLMPIGSYNDAINIQMASGDSPDIVFTYDKGLFNNLARQGGLADLGPIIDEYGPNLKSYLGDEILQYGQYKGEQLAVHAKMAFNGKLITWIRKDWLDALDLPIPSTTEEWYNALKMIKDSDPGNIGSDLIVYNLDAGPMANQDWQNENMHLCYSFVTEMTEEEEYSLSYLQMPGWKEGVRLMNTMYNDGLIDSEFALNNPLNDAIANGTVASFSHAWWYPWAANRIGILKEANPDAELIPIAPFQNYEGKYPKVLSPPTGMTIMVPKSSERVVEAVKFLDWMSIPENGKTIMYGFEGIHHELDENGLFSMTADTEGAIANPRLNNLDLSILYNGWTYEGDMAKVLKGLGNIAVEPVQRLASATLSVEDGYLEPVFSTPIDTLGTYKGTLDKIFQETMIKSIMASPADFDAAYAEGLDEYMNSGGTAVMEEKIAAYRAMQ